MFIRERFIKGNNNWFRTFEWKNALENLKFMIGKIKICRKKIIFSFAWHPPSTSGDVNLEMYVALYYSQYLQKSIEILNVNLTFI